MNRRLRLMLRVLLLLLVIGVVLGNPNTPHTTAHQTTTSCTLAPEAPGSVDRGLAGPAGELSLEQKHAAFDEVLRERMNFGDYDFPVAVTQSQRSTFAPVLLKSMAGIESDWTHYKNGQTNLNSLSCDFGLMQINEVAQEALFAKQPSLRGDTRANIAASAQTLSELWDKGLFETLPLVNDGDPSWLPNWYYVLSSYNGGPASVWANNPACGSVLLTCSVGGTNYIYSPRRPAAGLAEWSKGTQSSYPYQERVLNNLPFPLRLAQHPTDSVSEWLAEGLGIQRFTSQLDSGLFPEDAIFVRRDPSTGEPKSYASNLILFRHRVQPLDPTANAQLLTVEYDLPFAALVTTTLVLENGSEVPLCSQSGKAGWNRHFCPVTMRLQEGDSYRIRAERGSPSDPAGYSLGQHRLLLRFHSPTGPFVQPDAMLYLPLVQNTGRPLLLLNHEFAWANPQQGWKPDYWDVQVLASRTPAGLTDITRLMGRLPMVPGWVLRAAPGAVIDMRQRIALPPGRYLLRVQLDVQGRDARSLLTVRTRPAAPAPQPWTVVANIDAAGNSQQNNDYWLDLDGPTTISLLAAFGQEDNQSAFVLRAVELFR